MAERAGVGRPGRLMAATLARPPAGDEFAVEVKKYDGQRGLIDGRRRRVGCLHPERR